MTRFLIIKTIFALTVLISCGQENKHTANDTEEQEEIGSSPTLEPILVDYKSDTYKISLGDNFKSSDSIIDWGWAAESDIDGRIDSTGKDAFLYLGEPLIVYNGEEWLPSLHIETDRNIISSFTCSLLFDLADTVNAVSSFLGLLDKDIKQLHNDDVINSIINKGVYEKTTQDYIETFRLVKGEGHEYDKFEYTVKPR